MPIITTHLPISLYIHIPWCVKKCPYCDFNSHATKEALPEAEYIAALMHDLNSHLHYINDRKVISIFFGGGTPSLFSPAGIEEILQKVSKQINLQSDVEITLEANPGTIDAKNFIGFKKAGVSRLSLGVQSLQDDKLKLLGRIHDSKTALHAIESAHAAGFDNMNIDIMYGLPNQTIDNALEDIQTALQFQPTHFSWYQLTIEPNTYFYHHPPLLPPDDSLWNMQVAGQELLSSSQFQQYEVSAYAKNVLYCKHNLNYWEFGDYLGIGAGAHSKITVHDGQKIVRFFQTKHPRDYLQLERTLPTLTEVTENDLIFEFMLNALRLTSGFSINLFSARTGLPLHYIETKLQQAKVQNLLRIDKDKIIPTELGKKFLNNLVEIFLPY